MIEIDKDSGLIIEDKILHDKVMDLWSYWCSLDVKHPDDIKDFHSAIHQIGRIITSRSFRKQHSGFWKE